MQTFGPPRQITRGAALHRVFAARSIAKRREDAMPSAVGEAPGAGG